MEDDLNKFRINIKITFPYQNGRNHHVEALKERVANVNCQPASIKFLIFY